MANFSTVTASSGSLVDIDATLFIQLGIFLVMLFLLSRLLFRPVVQLIEARHEATEGTLNAAVALEKEAAEIDKTAETKLAELRRDAGQEKDRMLGEAADKERDIQTHTREKSHVMVAELKAKAKADIAKTRQQLEKETDALASAVAAKLLGRSI